MARIAGRAFPDIGLLSHARAAESPRSGRNTVEDPEGVGAVSTCVTMGLCREELFGFTTPFSSRKPSAQQAGAADLERNALFHSGYP